MKTLIPALLMLASLPALAVNTGFPMPAAESPSEGSLDTKKDDPKDQVREPSNNPHVPAKKKPAKLRKNNKENEE